MGILRRVGDIISANLNDLMDCFEDPEKMLRQAIREVETLIQESKDGAAKAIASEKLMSRELASRQEEVKTCENRAGRALRLDELPRARKLIKRKLEHEKFVSLLEKELNSVRGYSQSLLGQIESLQTRLAEARRKLTLLGARKRIALARKRLGGGHDLEGDGFTRFERMREKIELAEAEAEALEEVNTSVHGSPGAEDEAAETDPDVEEELAALKSRLE